ncbi:RELT-like protein 2 isoform X1 [Tympanuchus pallidicinctus]|uniref:RELT-like protein 2 isoform X1 n=1 Tax=Tympanuchus pallidicinctus TaxID=109042 RepID=UPI0022874202|nr:RELT-like protein 2 isoform X1 [Tympanuchus pallidicinctus]
MSDQSSSEDGESDSQHSLYMVFLLVLVFFIMGLVGFLICHVLKKKGYRCRTFRDELDPDNKDVLAELQANEEEELNEDTVEKIVRCIIQNEANAEALKEMLGDNDGDIAVPMPSLCPHRNSQDGGPPHHHTVHLGSTQAPCIHCSKRRRHPLHRQGRSKDGKGRMHPGETTVFSVGRFRVTHIGKKPAFHEQQDGAQPDGSKEPSTEELEHSSERFQREQAHNGTVPTGSLENGAVQEGTQGGKGTEQSRTGTPVPGTAVGSSPGSTSRQRRLLSHRVLGGSSPSIPGQLGQEEAGLGSADEVSDIHGSLSLHEVPDEMGREDSSRRQPGAENMGQQVGSFSFFLSLCGLLGWRG